MSEYREIRDGDELFSVPSNPWCDGCDGTEWEAIEDGRRCEGCGEEYRTVTYRERELRPDEGYVRVQRIVERREATGDERHVVSICTGRDDQRPDHDPEAGIYRPICVEQHLAPGDSAVYTYLDYCGHCRRKWDRAYDWLLCPYCGVTIGNYVFADGTEHWYPDTLGDWPPDVWLADPGKENE